MLTVVGCSGPEWLNFIAPMGTFNYNTGTFDPDYVTVIFVNETPYKVSTAFGTYNTYDLENGVTAENLSMNASEALAARTFACRRQFDVAGAALRQAATTARVDMDLSTIPDETTFTDPNSGDVVGSAPAAVFLLGVDYAANDVFEIHFKQVPGTTDQFTVEMIVVAHNVQP